MFHNDIIRALIAAQVATLEHKDETIGTPGVAKKALIQHLNAALKMAKQLED